MRQNCWPSRELSKDMWHATYTHVIQGDSKPLVVRNQIDTLIFGLSFSHNLYYKYSNGSCKPILNSYVLKYFQWYNERLNPMSFDPSNCSLKFLESTRTPIPKMGVHLGVCGLITSDSLALPKVWVWFLGYTLGLHLFMPSFWLQIQS